MAQSRVNSTVRRWEASGSRRLSVGGARLVLILSVPRKRHSEVSGRRF